LKTAALDRIARSVPFRLLAAALILGYHLLSVVGEARARYELPFDSAPGAPPHLVRNEIPNLHRLIVTRWDAGHYIGLSLRGYSLCADRPVLVNVEALSQTCDLSFYPGYPLLGAIVSAVTKAPIDYALWGLSMVASFFFLFMWTDSSIVGALGLGTTYLSLLAFNAFPTSCYLVFIMAEPCTLVFTMGALVAFGRKQYFLGALAAGAASGMRIGGSAASLAFAAAILTLAHQERARGLLLLRRLACVVLAGWGQLAFMAYQGLRFHDPLLYVHAHGAAYKVSGGLGSVLFPRAEWIMHAIDGTNHDLVWGFGLGIWFLLGHRDALRRFPTPWQVFCYGLVIITFGLNYAGSIEIYMRGFGRYALVAIPLFFAIAAFLRRRPLVFTVWLVACLWHYREVDVCYYLGDVGTAALRKCNMTQWIDW